MNRLVSRRALMKGSAALGCVVAFGSRGSAAASNVVWWLDSALPEQQATLTAALNPGEKRTLHFKLPHEWKYGAPKGIPGMRTLDTAHLDPIRVIVQWPFEPKQPDLLDVRISNLRCEDPIEKTEPMTEKQYVPFIDEYGQALGAYGHTFVPAGDPGTSAAEIGAATASQFGPRGYLTAVSEPVRRGGGSALVVRPSP